MSMFRFCLFSWERFSLRASAGIILLRDSGTTGFGLGSTET